MDKDTKTTLEQFTKKAIQRLKDKKIPKTATLHIPSMDEDIVIRSLTDEEVVECTNIEDDNDPNRADKYAIYMATKTPDLKAVSTELKNRVKSQSRLKLSIFSACASRQKSQWKS